MQLMIKRFSELTPEELYSILRLRSDVFVVEQQCIYSDPDGRDPQALHLWLQEGSEAIACLRILPAGLQGDTVAIGRVVTRRRREGLGRQLMQAGIEAAEQHFNADVIRLEAQCYAQRFYEKLGFAQISEPFLEDGIPHIVMEWRRSHA